MKRSRLRAYLGLGLLAAALVALALSGDLLAHAARYAVVYAVAVAGFGLLATAATSLPWRGVLVAAVLLRLVFLPVTPSLSDDVYRYLWDGRVQLSGVNPYRHAPRDAALDAVDFADRERINHPGLRTVYPPLAEATFLAVAAAKGGVVALKLVFGFFDAVTAAGLWWLAGARRRQAVTLYLLCPAVILQTWGSAHVEAVGMCFAVLTALALARGRDGWAGVALGLAVAAKVTPLVLLVPALVGGRAKPARFLAGLLPTLAVLYLPYVLTGGAFGSLWQAGTGWTGASLGFSLLVDLLPRRVALTVSAVVVVAGAAWIARRLPGRARTAAAFAWTLTLSVAFLPIVHAWYWLAPLALGLAAGVWLPVVVGVVAPLATALPGDWAWRLPPWSGHGVAPVPGAALVPGVASRGPVAAGPRLSTVDREAHTGPATRGGPAPQ